MPQTFHHILRIYIPEYAFEDRIKDILYFCRKTECKEVLLFTSSYDLEPSFVSLEQIKHYTDAVLKPAAKLLRDNGIIVSLNVMQTLGHVYFPESIQQAFPFQRRVGMNGQTSHAGACPLCENLRRWVADSYRVYAELQPRVMLVDDDFRANMEQLSCFCKLHLDMMSELYGSPVKREEVVNAVLSDNWPIPELREIYFEATTKGFAKLASIIRDAVKPVSPQTQLGVMMAAWPTGTAGLDWDIVLQALTGNEIPIVRPQINVYHENAIRDIPRSFTNPDCLRSTMAAKVEFWPEIENYPFTGYSKSARLTMLQMFVQLMNGFNHHALDLFDFFDQPFCEYEEVTEMLAVHKPQFDAISKMIEENHPSYGLKACMHKYTLKVRRSVNDWFGGHNLVNHIPSLGLPLTYSGKSDWQLFCGDDILAFSDVEIDAMLAKGALMDATTAEALTLKGYSERIGVAVGNYIAFDKLGYEEYLWPETVSKGKGRRYPLRLFLGNKPDWQELRPLTKNHISASVIRNYRGEQSGIGMLLTENLNGERFAVLGFSQDSSQCFMGNRLRANQMRHALEWIARKPLPLVVSSAAPYLWPIVNRTSEGMIVIGIVNLSTDRVDVIPLLSDDSIPWSEISRLNTSGEHSPLEVKRVALAGQSTLWHISCSLEPLEFAVFVQN